MISTALCLLALSFIVSASFFDESISKGAKAYLQEDLSSSLVCNFKSSIKFNKDYRTSSTFIDDYTLSTPGMFWGEWVCDDYIDTSFSFSMTANMTTGTKKINGFMVTGMLKGGCNIFSTDTMLSIINNPTFGYTSPDVTPEGLYLAFYDNDSFICVYKVYS